MNSHDVSEDVWDEDSAYLEMLAREVRYSNQTNIYIDIDVMYQGARLREKSEKQADGVPAEDSDDEESDVEEELGYISALDKVDPYASFKQALTSMLICLYGQ